MKSTFIVVADRGHLRAFRAEEILGRAPRLAPVGSFELAEGYQKVSQKLEDDAGRFPVGGGPASGKGGGNGRHQNSISEKHYELEDTRRIARELAHRITAILGQENHPAWSFAAPAAIKDAVLDELGTEERKRLQDNVAADLVKISEADLVSHFPSLKH